MNVLMISGDPRALVPNTETYQRMGDYEKVLGRLRIIAPGKGGALRRLFLLWRQGVRLCLQQKFDVITAQGPDEFGLISYFLSRRFKVPLQIQIHTDVFSPWYRRASWKEYTRYLLAGFLIPRANCLRVVSQRIKSSILQATSYKLQASRITVLPIFTDISKFLSAVRDPKTEERFKEYDFKMIAVGRLVDKEKNSSMLIEIMREFVKICPKALLVLVGDGPDKKSYQLLVTDYRLERNVIIESWRDDLPSFYRTFDLFLLPSNYEGWGRVVIEAMASGLPAVMTDVGLAGEALVDGKNGRVAPVGDKRKFLDAIIEIYRSPEKRAMLAKAGQESVETLKNSSRQGYLLSYRRTLEQCVE